MSSGGLLVVGTSIDPHIDRVIDQLPPAVHVRRLNVDEFPRSSSISIDHDPRRGTSLQINDWTPSSPETQPSVLWFRRLGRPGLPKQLEPKYERYAYAESDHVLESFLSLVQPKRWINEYWHCRRAALKPLQLSEARACGLATPATLVTSRAERAHLWFRSNIDAIAKTLSSPVVYSDDDGARGFAFTHVLSADDDAALDRAAPLPVQFQELVRPQFELRVTSIGSLHVAVRIDTDSVEARGLRDWRSDHVSCTYSWFLLPESVGAKLTNLLGRLGLDYAATDFIVTAEGEYVFLESNPHGAWLWLEEALGDDRITRSIAAHIGNNC